MKNKDYVSVTMFVFLVVGLVHFWRAFNNLPLNIGSTAIPVSASWLAGLAALFLAYSAYKLRS